MKFNPKAKSISQLDKFGRVFNYARPYRLQLIGIFFLVLLNTVMTLPQPIVLKFLIDDILPAGNTRMLSLMLGALLGLYILQNVVSFGQKYLTSITSQQLLIDIRQQIHDHLQKLSPHFYDHAQIGDLMSRVLSDANSVQAIAATALITLLTNIITLVIITGIIFYMNWRLALISSVTIPGFAIIIFAFNKPIHRASLTVREETANVNSHLQEFFSGIQIVQSFTQEMYESQKFFTKLRSLARASVHSEVVNWKAGIAGGLVVFIGPLLVLWYGGLEVVKGALTIGSLIAFYSYLGKLYGPTSALVQTVLNIQSALAGVDRTFALLDIKVDVQERPNAKAIPEAKGRVSFKGVSFRYNNSDTFALKNIGFVAEPGTVTAIVGPSGAGKSTLVKLLCRFYDPQSGSITLDSHDFRDVKLDFLRGQIGIVSQDTFLFNTSIKENVRYGRMEASDSEIVEACKLANIHNFILSLPYHYDTVVGERGVKLSGGQKQRIAIARAILRDPMLLILDEATSSLDANVEASIQTSLEMLMNNRTTFIVAHRLSTIRDADYIIVLEQGQIVEQGVHSELSQRNGLYQELYDKQMKEKEVFEDFSLPLAFETA